MNNLSIVGRLVSEPIKEEKIVRFTIAIPRYYKDENGIYETDFIDCETNDYTGDTLKEYCRKGDIIGVRGRIESKTYLDESENRRRCTYVKAETISFISSNKNNNMEEIGNE